MRRIVDLAEEMLELLMAVGQVFLVEDCVEPLTLYNTALKTELSELLQSLDATRYAQLLTLLQDCPSLPSGVEWRKKSNIRGPR